MKEAEEISHIHQSQVSQSGFNAKVNTQTFRKLQDRVFFLLFLTFSALYNDYNIRLKKKKPKKLTVQDLFLSESKWPRTGFHNRETNIKS